MTDVSVWERLDELTDDQLATLVSAARQVIAESTDDPDVAALADAPPGVAGDAVAAVLGSPEGGAGAAVADAVADDDVRARDLSLIALRAVAAEPALAEAVADAYRARRDMLAVDGGLIIGLALLALVLKLKRIKIGKVDISFYEARDGLIAQLKNLFGR